MIGASVQRCSGAVVLGALVLSAIVVSPAAAQHEGHQPARPATKAEPQPQPEKVLGWEPIRCWRQTSTGAVTIGQTLTLVLTCAAYEGDNAQVIPDEARLGVASIQLAPFEIVGGSHPPDVRRGSRRFFQYEYQLRLISPDAIGHDVNIPPLTISYRIQSRVGAAATLQGRDLSYLMPMLPIKVLSLVPADASDIRDASGASLAAVDSLRYRSSLFQVLTITFGALAAVLLVLAFVPLARANAGADTATPDRVPDRAVLAAATAVIDKTLTKVSEGDGWTDEQLASGLGATRLVAACAIHVPVSQKPLGPDRVVPDGRFLVEERFVRRRFASVASSVTAADVARARATGTQQFSMTRLQQLERLESTLTVLTAAMYQKAAPRDTAVLADALSSTMSLAREIAAERGWWRARWARR